MRDDQAHFFIAVADLCAAASLARLPLEVLTASGQSVQGVPSPVPSPHSGEEELDETGYGRAVLIDDAIVDLADVRRCSISAPQGEVKDP